MEALSPQMTASLAAGSSFSICGFPETNYTGVFFIVIRLKTLKNNFTSCAGMMESFGLNVTSVFDLPSFSSLLFCL